MLKTTNSNQSHQPVLLDEILKFANLKPHSKICDATLGLGGHAFALLQKITISGKLFAFETDERNLKLAKQKLKYFKNIDFFHKNFCQLIEFIPPNSLDFLFFDLGISSPHLDCAERGFSFRHNGPCDMRLDQRQNLTAAKILNFWPESEIAKILRNFGEIGISKKIARQIIEFRQKQKFTTTTKLAELIKPKSLRPQVFQALRIAVNNELENLTIALNASLKILKPSGRIAVISFHSLEDRIVKNFFRLEARTKNTLKILTKKPIRPSEIEVQKNPRSRSAKLRVAEKV
jgi:16S rRNA (cytosine1402-N4)-methyltransferase